MEDQIKYAAEFRLKDVIGFEFPGYGETALERRANAIETYKSMLFQLVLRQRTVSAINEVCEVIAGVVMYGPNGITTRILDRATDLQTLIEKWDEELKVLKRHGVKITTEPMSIYSPLNGDNVLILGENKELMDDLEIK